MQCCSPDSLNVGCRRRISNGASGANARGHRSAANSAHAVGASQRRPRTAAGGRCDGSLATPSTHPTTASAATAGPRAGAAAPGLARLVPAVGTPCQGRPRQPARIVGAALCSDHAAVAVAARHAAQHRQQALARCKPMRPRAAPETRALAPGYVGSPERAFAAREPKRGCCSAMVPAQPRRWPLSSVCTIQGESTVLLLPVALVVAGGVRGCRGCGHSWHAHPSSTPRLSVRVHSARGAQARVLATPTLRHDGTTPHSHTRRENVPRWWRHSAPPPPGASTVDSCSS